MDETNKNTQDNLQGKPGQPSGVQDGGTSTGTIPPKTYTKAELEKAIEDALSARGRDVTKELKPVLTERDTYKTNAETASARASELEAEIKDLQEQLDELAGEDTNKKDYLKAKRELTAELRRKVTDAETEKKKATELWVKNEELVKEAKAFKREKIINMMVSEYEGADSTKLLKLCEDRGITDKDEIVKVADILWSKKNAPRETSQSPGRPDSGMTLGGGIALGNLPPKERLGLADNKLRTLNK